MPEVVCNVQDSVPMRVGNKPGDAGATREQRLQSKFCNKTEITE